MSAIESNAPMLSLSLLETRVLGVLIEKQHTVADAYPLTLNALVAGCNQKTSRDPVLDASAAEVQLVLDALRARSLVMESSGGRVMRYAHNTERVLHLPSQAVALLATLMLRGHQTLSELRINSDRLHKFADLSAVEGFLGEMIERSEGALVVELPRRPGERENRWAHLLSGEPIISTAATPMAADDAVTLGEIAALKRQMSELQEDVTRLRATVARLCGELGVPPEV